MTLITMDGEYQTRDGRPRRVLCVDALSTTGFSVITIDRVGNVNRYMSDGRFTRLADTHPEDLIPVPKKHKRTYWLVHWSNLTSSYATDPRLDSPVPLIKPIAITGPHEIEFTEGEGLKGADDAQADD